MCDIRINLRYAGSVFPLALKIQTQSGRRRDWTQLRPRSRFSQRGRQRPLFISLFSMAAELWTRSLFASSNKFKCNQVLFKGRHSSCEQACVHNVLCTAHFWLSGCRLSSRCRGCLFSNSSGVIRECSPDAAALTPFIWRRLLLTYIHLHRARPLSPVWKNKKEQRWQLSSIQAMATLINFVTFDFQVSSLSACDNNDFWWFCHGSESVLRFLWSCIWQVSGDSLDGGGSQQHCQMSETHRRPRAVPHISDPPGIKGEDSGMF